LIPVRVAGFWRRLLALLLDATILALTAGPVHYVFLRATGGWLPELAKLSWISALQLMAAELEPVLLWLAPVVAMGALYILLFTALLGRTPGQRAAGLLVITRTGQRPRILVSIARLLGLAASALAGGLGALWILVDREKRALHDHIAGTYVVRDT
jgi:uncharacterized RDD family membrane protein YckC